MLEFADIDAFVLGMRQARFKAPEHFPSAFYHCISRVAGRHFLFGRPEKERFVDFLRRYELFTGVRAVTFCVMDNHFHLLLEVRKRPEIPLTDGELTARIAALDGRLGASEVQQALENLRSIGAHDAAEAVRESYFVQMWDSGVCCGQERCAA